MAKDPSVAPKERVNIVYRPSGGNSREEVELPLKMLIIGDFTGGPDQRALESRLPVNIDKDSFNDVLESHAIEMNFRVPNRLVPESKDEPAELDVKLKIKSVNKQTMKLLNPDTGWISASAVMADRSGNVHSG